MLDYLCDAPARALVKIIKHHTGYFGCEKCKTEGVYKKNRLRFPEISASKRTDNDFSDGHYTDHCRRISPLLKIPGTKMFSQFPLDYLYLVCLCAIRKLLRLWISGPLKIGFQETVHKKFQVFSLGLVNLYLQILLEN